MFAEDYFLALGVAFIAGFLVSDRSPIFVALFADVAATCVIYLFGRIFHNSSFYDPYWSLAPIAISIYWMLTSRVNPGWQQLIVLALVGIWGRRLTWHWAQGWNGLSHEDWRYSDLRQKTKVVLAGGVSWYRPHADAGGLPGLPGALSRSYVRTYFWSDRYRGDMVTSAAIIIETVSDEQLRQFSKASTARYIMESGLWAYSRHPNYLGEIMFWWGLYLSRWRRKSTTGGR